MRRWLSPPSEPASSDEGQRVGYPRPEVLGEDLVAGGLAHLSTSELTVHADYESFENLFRPFATGVGQSGACFAALGPEANHGCGRTLAGGWTSRTGPSP
jgi:hypothetical protein